MAESAKEKALITKEKIIKATIKIVNEKGFHKTTTRDIVKEAGVSTGNLYHHFKSKEEIILELLQVMFCKVQAEDKKINEKETSPDKILVQKLKFIINTIKAEPGIFKIIYHEAINLIYKDEYAELFKEHWNRIFMHVASYVEKGREQGLFEFSGSPKDIAMLLVNNVHGFFYFSIFYKGIIELTDEKIDTLIKYIFSALNYSGGMFNENK